MNHALFIKSAACATAILLLFPSRTPAGLQWEQTEITVNMPDGQDTAQIAFPFKNTGAQSVAIMSVEVSCSCLKFDPINKEYAPGEGGTLNLHYHGGVRSNAMAYKVTVRDTDTEKPVTTLMVNVAASTSFQIDPGSAGWQAGTPAATRELLFRDVKNIGAKPVAAYSTNENFTVEITPRHAPGEYAIKVTPKSTDVPGGAYIYIDVAYPDGKTEKTKVLAAILDPNSKKVLIK